MVRVVAADEYHHSIGCAPCMSASAGRHVGASLIPCIELQACQCVARNPPMILNLKRRASNRICSRPATASPRTPGTERHLISLSDACACHDSLQPMTMRNCKGLLYSITNAATFAHVSSDVCLHHHFNSHLWPMHCRRTWSTMAGGNIPRCSWHAARA